MTSVDPGPGATRCARIRLRLRRLGLAFACAAFSVGAIQLGCDRNEDVPPPPPAEPTSLQPEKPRYEFAAQVREQYPQVAAFVQEFLEICLAGDYPGYRRLASRQREPESRERFEAIIAAIRALRIEAVERIRLDFLSDEVYRIIADVTFDPESQVRLRRRTGQFAILVLREQGELRMLPAPAALQPEPPPAPQTQPTSAPATQPRYPWDERGNF